MSHDFRSRFRHASRLTAAAFPFTIPLALLLLATLFLQATNYDLQISANFYDAQNRVWSQADQNPWELIDQWCVFPGFLLGVGAIVFACHGLIRKQWNFWTKAGALLAMVFLLGPGLLVNGTMKPTFSRPRPREVVELGGDQLYQPAFGFGEKTKFNASFPSGHASIGFFLIAPAFLFRRKRKTRRLFLVTGLMFGGMMSVSRIVQGGHYLSDTLWSLGIIYFLGWFTLTIMLTRELRKSTIKSKKAESITHRIAA